MRALFLGTPDFAVPTLQALLDAPDVQVVGVITQPDRPAGRGRKLTTPPVKRLALQHGLPVLQPERLRKSSQVIDFLQERAPDLAVVAAYGQILPASFFDHPPLGTLNVHASLLPKYRGAAPVVHALLNGERETGVTIMRIDAGLDTGAILAALKVPIEENTTAGELEQVLAEKGAALLIDTLPGYAAGRRIPQPQNDLMASYAHRLKKDDARIDWSQPSTAVHNRIRAFNPRPGAFTVFRGEAVKIWLSRKRPVTPIESAVPGQVLARETHAILVGCGNGTVVAILELQLPNRRRSSASDFANGVGLKRGEVFA
ncbi:MAG: methionyl-tRNA formyltransferase [Acidobacteriota bacterium]